MMASGGPACGWGKTCADCAPVSKPEVCEHRLHARPLRTVGLDDKWYASISRGAVDKILLIPYIRIGREVGPMLLRTPDEGNRRNAVLALRQKDLIDL